MLLNLKEGVILPFFKPLGWTSFQVVGRSRWWFKKKYGIKKIKVGHAGTLDPLATGVLVVCIGKATKRIEELQTHSKEYVATIKLGATTPSFDKETEEDATYPVEHITRELIEQTLNTFIGEIQQVPPVFSAVKIGGKRAYKMARRGDDVELAPKKVNIYEIELIEFHAPDELKIRVVCGKGTYIRSLARDLGTAMNTGAYLTALCRTRVGDFTIDDCLDASHFSEWLDEQEIKFEEE